MSDTPASWQPDPYGRFAQRYFDGTNWTANVTDASGAQLTDPPGYSSAPTASATSSPPVPGLVVAGVGAVLLLLSLFVLNWYDFSSEDKAQLRTSSDEVEQALGISASDLTDGIKFSELKDIADVSGSDGAPFVTEQYLNWGYVAAIAAVAFAFVALFRPSLRVIALAVLAVFVLWHGWVVFDTGDQHVSTQLGSWLGSVGLLLAIVALVLPRQMSVARAT